jgi:outer membrane murein-binding lipoprotein Lpp
MSRARKAVSIMIVTTLGLWGCAQEQNRGHSSARIRALESKNAKLEDDFRAVVAAREQMRKKLAAAEQERARLNDDLEQLQNAARERDELRQQVKSRTNERDSLQKQFDQFRTEIRTLLGKADSACNPLSDRPVTAAFTKHRREKS